MQIVEIVGGVLVLALAVVVTVALYVGVLGSIGALRLARCRHCGHLGIAAPREPLLMCSRCRHPHLLHPLHVHHRAGPPPGSVVAAAHEPLGAGTAPDRDVPT